jgi:hypothetical protein
LALLSFGSPDTKKAATSEQQGIRETMASMKLKDFPDDLHRQAESRAALEGITLLDLVIRAVTNYLESPITLEVQEVIVKRKDLQEEER